DPDEPPIGDWDRPPRAWADPRLQPEEDTENTWFRKWDEEPPEDRPDPAVTAVQPRIPDGAAAAAEPKGDTWVGPAGSAGDADTWRGPAEPKDDTDTWAGPGVEPKEEGPSGSAPEEAPEPDTAVTPVGREEPAASFSGQLEDAERLSGQLRSLFESEQKSGAQPETPYVPPVGAEATQVMPAVADDEDVPPLPQRTPGAGPHPGRDSGWSGPMVKGHSASRQYHTPESPQYDDIVADVWFRSAKDAEIAGFTSWNGG
ncbi:sunset domain-containing protein, partial [Saccharopolyspora kobensis]